MEGSQSVSKDEVLARVRRGLVQELENLEKVKPGLGTRVADYVATGDPAGVLGDLAANPDSSAALRIGAHTFRDDGKRPIYAEVADLPPAILLRFAKCLEASVQPMLASGRNWTSPPLLEAAPWVDRLLLHARGCGLNYHNSNPVAPALSTEMLAAALAEENIPSEDLVGAVFALRGNKWATEGLQRIARMTDFPDVFARHSEQALFALISEDPDERLHALEVLRHMTDESLLRFAERIAYAVTNSRKVVRGSAMRLLARIPAALLEPLQAIATNADPAERALAVEALGELATQHGVIEALPFIRARRGVEKAKSVLAVIDALELRLGGARAAAAGSRSAVAEEADVPELPTVELQPLPSILRPAWDAAVVQANKAFADVKKAGISAADAEAMWKYVGGEAETAPRPDMTYWDNVAGGNHPLYPFGVFLHLDGIEPVHVVRLYAVFDYLKQRKNQSRLGAWLIRALNDYHRKHKRPSLIEVEAMLAPHDARAPQIGSAFAEGFATKWSGEQVWPFFARHMELVHKWLKLEMGNYYYSNRDIGFDAVSMFPQPPAEVVPRLMEIALGSAKADRERAQKALEKLPRKEDIIVAALSGGKAEARTFAAQWLAQLQYGDAVPALEAALGKEKNDAAIGAMMSALEALGMDVDKYLDRDKLADEAAKGLAKGLPPALSWFPWDKMSEVRWASPSPSGARKGQGVGEGRGGGEVVPREVLQWLLAQATKLKTPEPNALLRRYAAKLEPSDREAFGRFVLDEWLGEEKAGGRAIDAKGLLAVAAACGGRETVISAGAFIKEHYGTRAAQCKALIVMLAWTDHPNATQLMLSIGHRFRTKGIQDEAQIQAELLAERRGWTVADLADRTIPSAGFGDDGTIDLSYGSERKFSARLGELGNLDVYDGEGRKIKALPEPRQAEEVHGGQAKRLLAAAKKDVKTIVTLQADRLYEALCTQRTWRFEDWERYLNRHPVVRRLLQGLVWGELRDGQVGSTFRPLDDGTLTDVNDAAVNVAPEAKIVLAHDTNLDAAGVAAWKKHLADYEVAAPFPQLGKGAYTLPKELEDATELTDFRGHVLQSFTLRGRATKLGYVRGAAEDGGWFYEYRKRFPSLGGLEALIRFSGSEMPEKNQDVALMALVFTRPDENGVGTYPVALSAVPAVLLSECYNDMRLIAAEGRGFDPEWERLER